MHRVFVSGPAPAGEDVRLHPDDSHYVTRVVRLRPGARLWVSDGHGMEAEAELTRVEGGHAWVRPGPWRRAVYEAALPVTLVQAVPKGDRMDWLVQKATEVGVRRIIPLVSARSVVRFDDGERAGTRRERWQRIARESARQVHRGFIPEVHDPVDLSAALEAVAREPGARGFIPWEALPPLSLRNVLLRDAPPAHVYIFIGPEGGWEPAEVEAARERGVEPVNLGPRILRSETAGIVALALTISLWGESA